MGKADGSNCPGVSCSGMAEEGQGEPFAGGCVHLERGGVALVREEGGVFLCRPAAEPHGALQGGVLGAFPMVFSPLVCVTVQ